MTEQQTMETPAEVEQPPADIERQEHDVEHLDTETREGIPAAHLAVGGATGGTVGMGLLYQLTGIPGLIAGGALATAGTVAYVRHRYGRRGAGQSWSLGSTGRNGSKGSLTGALGRSRGGSVLSGLRSPGRSSGGARSGRIFGGSGRATGPVGRAARAAAQSVGAARQAAAQGIRADRSGKRSASTSGRSTGARSTGPIRQTVARARRAAEQIRQTSGRTAAAARTAGRRTSAAVGGTARAARQAAGWVDRATGGRAGRAVMAAGRAARRAAIYADRKTGRRVSGAYAAARKGKTWRDRYRRAAQAAGKGGILAAPVVALIAALADRWHARKARKAEAAKAAEAAAKNSENTTETTPETSEKTEGPETVVHGETGRPAVTATATCPRCGAQRTATLAADADEVTTVCDCGYKIRFVRIPEGPATTTTADAGPRHRRPSTTSPAYNRRSHAMSVNPLAHAAAEMNAVAAGHAPADMWQVARELDTLDQVPANVGMAIRTYTMRLQGDYPIHPAVVEALAELYLAHGALVERAQMIGALFRQAHAEDLKREEAPRTNEAAWNI